MSLDFYLEGEEVEEECICSCCDNVHLRKYIPILFQANITHNLTGMAVVAGVYKCLWRPDENGFEYAHQIIKILEIAYLELEISPTKFCEYNPLNGWGSYPSFKS